MFYISWNILNLKHGILTDLQDTRKYRNSINFILLRVLYCNVNRFH